MGKKQGRSDVFVLKWRDKGCFLSSKPRLTLVSFMFNNLFINL